MAEGVAELEALLKRLEGVASGESMRRIQHRVGRVAKVAVTAAATETLGSDRAMHNFKGGRVRLGVGYDLLASTGLVLNLRPRGMWILAQSGRRSSGVIRPKRRRGASAVMTPEGPRARSRYMPSRGKDAIRRAETNVQKVAGRATDDAVALELARVVRG